MKICDVLFLVVKHPRFDPAPHPGHAFTGYIKHAAFLCFPAVPVVAISDGQRHIDGQERLADPRRTIDHAEAVRRNHIIDQPVDRRHVDQLVHIKRLQGIAFGLYVFGFAVDDRCCLAHLDQIIDRHAHCEPVGNVALFRQTGQRHALDLLGDTVKLIDHHVRVILPGLVVVRQHDDVAPLEPFVDRRFPVFRAAVIGGCNQPVHPKDVGAFLAFHNKDRHFGLQQYLIQPVWHGLDALHVIQPSTFAIGPALLECLGRAFLPALHLIDHLTVVIDVIETRHQLLCRCQRRL